MLKPNKSTVAAAALAMVALVSGCASSDSRLVGNWRSNRALSIATFPHRDQLTSDKRAFFDSMFGRLTLTYTRRYIQTELPPKGSGQPFRQSIPYRVLASDANSVTIVLKDTLTGHDATKQIHFVGADRYWIHLGTKDSREYFDRLSK